MNYMAAIAETVLICPALLYIWITVPLCVLQPKERSPAAEAGRPALSLRESFLMSGEEFSRFF